LAVMIGRGGADSEGEGWFLTKQAYHEARHKGKAREEKHKRPWPQKRTNGGVGTYWILEE